jgi:hypothetical protein
VAESAEAAAEGASGDRLTATVGYLSFNTFDLWPVYWAYLGAPRGPLLIVEGALAATAAWAVWRLRGTSI